MPHMRATLRVSSVCTWLFPLHTRTPTQVWSISLCDADVDLDESHPRQIKLATRSGELAR